MVNARAAPPARTRTRPGPHQGITLVVVLILLVVMSLTAAVAMRSAITQEKVVNNFRQESTAQSLAEFALGYCESELQKLSGDRTPELQSVENLPTRTMSALQWDQPSAWVPAVSGGTPGAAFLSLDSALVHGAPSPQCLVERLSMSQSKAEVVVVTARGFSQDYRADAKGQRISGSAVWLQSFLYFE